MYRVLFVCKEYGWVHRVPQVFPELELSVDRVESLSEAATHQQQNPSDVLVLDVELLDPRKAFEDQVHRLAATSHVILLAPTEFDAGSFTAALGFQVLRKPITAGEVGLALKRASRIR